MAMLRRWYGSARNIRQPFVDGPLPNWAEAPFFDGYVADANTLFVVQMFLMNWAEVRRWQDMKTLDPSTPIHMMRVVDALAPMSDTLVEGFSIPWAWPRVQKNRKLCAPRSQSGRLAMVAAMGCFIQHDVTGTGPVANLKAHLADPSHVTVFQNFHPFSF